MNLDHEHLTHELGDDELRQLYASHRRRADGDLLPEWARRFYGRLAEALRDTILDRDDVLEDLAADLLTVGGAAGGIITGPEDLADELEHARAELRRAARRDAGQIRPSDLS